MKIKSINSWATILGITVLVSACSVAQLEARLEANPQCKDVINPKTGALMPCPGSDKAFYREVGLVPAKASTAANTPAKSVTDTKNAASPMSGSTPSTTVSVPKTSQVQADCKPQIHKKTGGTLPCPSLD